MWLEEKQSAYGRVIFLIPVGHKSVEIILSYKHSMLCPAVIWNPWSEKAKAMADFGDDEVIASPVSSFANHHHNMHTYL